MPVLLGCFGFLALAFFGLAALMALSYPVYEHIFIKAREVQAKNDAYGLANAIRSFYSEYSDYPVPALTKETTMQSSAPIMLVLIAEEPDNAKKLNPRDIAFFAADRAKDNRAGLTADNTFLDPWGSPYIIILDTDFDTRILDPISDETFPSRAEVYSPGPDQDPNTWQDNIRTW
ncbi:MAG: hypothetical protein AAF591_16170 [Verrucomicrobiota bacterium]